MGREWEIDNQLIARFCTSFKVKCRRPPNQISGEIMGQTLWFDWISISNSLKKKAKTNHSLLMYRFKNRR